jgi:aminomethyltransferase
MGEFLVQGSQALDLVQYITTNDASKLTDGKIQYSCLPNGSGGIVDDLLVYRINENAYFLVVNASNIQKNWDWITQNNHFDATITDQSNDLTLLAVQGPQAATALQTLTDTDLKAMEYYTFAVAEFAGIPDVLISATGYTGAGGFEIYVPNAYAQPLWDAIFAAGAPYGIAPIGLGARDTLRLEMGYCLYGHDIDDHTSPLEAGLGWITKLNKTADFIDKNYLINQKKQGLTRKLIGFEMQERGIARQHYPICDANGNEIGVVTSGTESPSTGKLIGLGYVATTHTLPDIYIKIREKLLRATIAKPPFVAAGV